MWVNDVEYICQNVTEFLTLFLDIKWQKELCSIREEWFQLKCKRDFSELRFSDATWIYNELYEYHT